MTADQPLRIAYLVLAHDEPARLQRLINKLREDPDGQIIIHYDRKSPRKEFRELVDANRKSENVHFLQGRQRVRCGWGQFSIVQATLNLIQHGLSLEPASDYFYLLSGACYPVKPLSELKSYLKLNKGKTFIECGDSNWIKDGIREDRYLYHHWLNFRKHRWLFRRLYWLQRDLGIKRKLPEPIKEVRFGSQWWCLPQDIIVNIMGLLRNKPEVKKFFKSVWIPDECFFQSLIGSNNDFGEMLTYYDFDEDGRPKIFRLSDVDQGDIFFLRKVDWLSVK